ncbi:hypothetical protein [Azospirillum sp. BE72]|uniref:hypothetical protein n=1 Tax=Azospirillum sp. BE72 TaxID=2817776 RepID=UPI00285EC579|nr:hypothetical protein [Azospirillum sp. BE72]MDR6775685.1 hypothetical protein [Azospirillum sp. BE72]
MERLEIGKIRDRVREREEADRLLWLRRENMPAELARGRLVLSEEEVRTNLPVPLLGRPDQVFMSDAGLLVPVDTKTRRLPRVFVSDIVQLSVYGTILNFTTDPRFAGRDVAAHGYVRMPTLAGVAWARVALLKPAAVVELWADHWRRTEAQATQAA